MLEAVVSPVTLTSRVAALALALGGCGDVIAPDGAAVDAALDASYAGDGPEGADAGAEGGKPVAAHCVPKRDVNSYAFNETLEPAAKSPGSVPAAEVPQFVSFGWDDNGRSQAVNWTLEVAAKRTNATGSPVRY